MPFPRGSILVPTVIDEFGAAMTYLPIAFLPGVKQPAAVFLVGLKSGSNLVLDSWAGAPRARLSLSYPLIVGDVPGWEALLRVDEADDGITKKDDERLFTDAGEVGPTWHGFLLFVSSVNNTVFRLSLGPPSW